MRVKVILEQNSNQMTAYHGDRVVYQGNHTPAILEFMRGVDIAYFKGEVIGNNLFLEELLGD